MNPQQAENLRILIRHMENNVTRTLNMDRDYEACGAPACAAGEASTVAALRAAGMPGRCSVTVGGWFPEQQEVFGFSTPESWRLFGMGNYNAWKRTNVSGKEWAVEARKLLGEHGYAMEAMDDGFAAFKVKMLAPVQFCPLPTGEWV